MTWPYPNGVMPKPLSTVDHPLRSEPDPLAPPKCKHCGAGAESLIRRCLLVSRDGLIRRQKVFCKACGRTSRLPHGQRLKPKPAPGKILGLDRPKCPDCGSPDVWRSDERRWRCRWCRHGFVTERKVRSDNTSGFNRVSLRRGRWIARVPIGDKRFFLGTFESPELAARAYEEAAQIYVDSPSEPDQKLRHWEEVDPKDEARFLFSYAKRHDDIRGMRALISVNERARADLDFLVSQNALTAGEVESALKFRAEVLRAFDELAKEQERAQQRAAEFFRSRGFAPDANAASRIFAPQLDAEAAILAQTLEEVPNKGEDNNHGTEKIETSVEQIAVEVAPRR